MKDILNKTDIQYLVETFYSKALNDTVIGPVFKQADFKLEAHIPVMVAFWETLLFDVITYSGNPMLKHLELNRRVALKGPHFERWMQIWEETVSSEFQGPLAEKAVIRASSIAQLMSYKIQQAGHSTSL
ncbi:group III truncated hemoglobin [Pedobacter africanus]|uniref:Hemoglobin n=1 Tax=Pedobacter africanus TaxID=151894 RepID=A0A1W2CL91_9SPHI|nr:group III truncated hemoglobin [Pedobacter africanus]SMC85995.1 hemoglobin [Pedobacter africanus]